MLSIVLFTIVFIVICVLLYRNRINKQKKNKKVAGKIMRIFIIGISIIVCVYSAMLLDTHSLMVEVKNAFEGKIPAEITEGTPLACYNIRDRGYGAKTEKTDIGKTEVSLIRYFTIHNFKDGYIWAFYTNKAFDSNGEQFDGSGWIPTKWKIHKEKGKWEIVEIYEAP